MEDRNGRYPTNNENAPNPYYRGEWKKAAPTNTEYLRSVGLEKCWGLVVCRFKINFSVSEVLIVRRHEDIE